jgi:ferritin-like protein
VSVIRLQRPQLASVADARACLQTAVGVEFGTLPPYLYAAYSIRPETNPAVQCCLRSVALEEMVHMCLVCNILNALGGEPVIQPQTYPDPLPGDIGPDGHPLTLHLHPFSKEAIQQGMQIEQPEDPPDFPIHAELLRAEGPPAVTIGQFYDTLDAFLATLPANAWTPGRNQLTDAQFLQGQIFAVNGYDDAHRAIDTIISEGEGSRQGSDYDPLDFQGEIAHFFRFGEIFHDKVLTKTPKPPGYAWGPQRFGVDWAGVYPAITDPGLHDFSSEPETAQAAQAAGNNAFTAMVNALQGAVSGRAGALGVAVRAMFDLRTAARHAFTVPLTDGEHVSGPAFLYQPPADGGAR